MIPRNLEEAVSIAQRIIARAQQLNLLPPLPASAGA